MAASRLLWILMPDRVDDSASRYAMSLIGLAIKIVVEHEFMDG